MRIQSFNPNRPEKSRICVWAGLGSVGSFTTDDCRASCEELKSRGVEFTSEPEEMPYGIDCGFRDPSGNSARLTDVTW